MRKDGKKNFRIHGVYSSPSFDFRSKLVKMLDSNVGYYYPEFNDKGIINDFDDPSENDYFVFVASPAEEPLILITEMFDLILGEAQSDNAVVLFTYFTELHGEEFDLNELDALNKIGAMVERLGGKFIKSNSIEMLAGTLNAITNFG